MTQRAPVRQRDRVWGILGPYAIGTAALIGVPMLSAVVGQRSTSLVLAQAWLVGVLIVAMLWSGRNALRLARQSREAARPVSYIVWDWIVAAAFFGMLVAILEAVMLLRAGAAPVQAFG